MGWLEDHNNESTNYNYSGDIVDEYLEAQYENRYVDDLFDEPVWTELDYDAHLEYARADEAAWMSERQYQNEP